VAARAVVAFIDMPRVILISRWIYVQHRGHFRDDKSPRGRFRENRWLHVNTRSNGELLIEFNLRGSTALTHLGEKASILSPASVNRSTKAPILPYVSSILFIYLLREASVFSVARETVTVKLRRLLL
jgi:hypothetical protein